MYVCRIYQAYIPELGLSNKALEMISKQEKSEMVIFKLHSCVCKRMYCEENGTPTRVV